MGSLNLNRNFLALEVRLYIQQPQTDRGADFTLDVSRIINALPHHLISTADSNHSPTGEPVTCDIFLPSAIAQPSQIGNRALAPGETKHIQSSGAPGIFEVLEGDVILRKERLEIRIV